MANKLKIIVRLSGGLGNQLHQYAYGCFLCEKFQGDLFVDTSFYDLDPNLLKITSRKYELDQLMVKAKEYRFFISHYNLLRLILKFKFLKRFVQAFLKIKVVNERLPEKTAYRNERIYYVNEVFGTVKEYEQISLELHQQFTPKPEIFNQLQGHEAISGRENKVAIHIRRSDYLNEESVHQVLPLSYYTDAISVIKNKVEQPVFYLFGDDENWIKENFDLKSDQFKLGGSSGKNAHLSDFFAMINCDHCVISNSTFSWWAAYLNPNKRKIIVAPGVWLKNTSLNVAETYLTEWHVI